MPFDNLIGNDDSIVLKMHDVLSDLKVGSKKSNTGKIARLKRNTNKKRLQNEISSGHFK